MNPETISNANITYKYTLKYHVISRKNRILKTIESIKVSGKAYME